MNNSLTIAIHPDLTQAGKEIYKALRRPAKPKPEFQALVPDKLYSPNDVAEILSVSYNCALRLMESTSKTIDLSAPRTRKRLLRIRGKHLRKYLDGKQK